MRSLFIGLLHVVGLVVGNALGDPEVKAYLEGKGLSLGSLSEGTALSSKVREATVARESAMGRLKTLALALKTLFASIREEVSNLRLTIKAALRKRPDLLLKVGITPPRPRKSRAKGGGTEPEAKAAAPAAATAQPAEATGGQAEKPADGENTPRKKPRLDRIEHLLAVGRALIQGALDEPAVLAAVLTYGYTKETLHGFLGQLTELERQQLEQKAAKGMKQAATKAMAEAGQALRDWFYPWKRRISSALKGQADLRVRLGLPSGSRRRPKKEGDAQADAQGAVTTEHGATHHEHPAGHEGHVTGPAAQPTATASPEPTAGTPPPSGAQTK